MHARDYRDGVCDALAKGRVSASACAVNSEIRMNWRTIISSKAFARATCNICWPVCPGGRSREARLRLRVLPSLVVGVPPSMLTCCAVLFVLAGPMEVWRGLQGLKEALEWMERQVPRCRCRQTRRPQQE